MIILSLTTKKLKKKKNTFHTTIFKIKENSRTFKTVRTLIDGIF